MLAGLAVETGVPVDVWAREDIRVITTALAFMEEREKRAGDKNSRLRDDTAGPGGPMQLSG